MPRERPRRPGTSRRHTQMREILGGRFLGIPSALFSSRLGLASTRALSRVAILTLFVASILVPDVSRLLMRTTLHQFPNRLNSISSPGIE